MLSPILARTIGRSAGENYVSFVHNSLAAEANVTVIAPDSPLNRRALGEGLVDTTHLRAGTAQSGGRGTKLAFALAHRCYYRLVRVDTGAVPLPFAVSLVLDPDIRGAVRGADVIDLQWAEYVRLAWLVRLLNPSARLVGTFHDVLSQRFARYAEIREPGETLIAWRISTRIARRAERAAGRRCDVVIALSDKDRGQLRMAGSAAVFAVVDPPIRRSAEPEAKRRQGGDPIVLFVAAMDRDDNIDAVEWFVAEVWPHVILEFPAAQLRLVGSGAGPRVEEAARAGTRVTVTGFVKDLGPEYAAASAAVVPLRVGAGIKFKTIEALLAGVPVVTTSVGAEGIAGAERFWGLSDEREEFTHRVLAALHDPEAAQEQADRTQTWALQRYDAGRIARELLDLYRVSQ